MDRIEETGGLANRRAVCIQKQWSYKMKWDFLWQILRYAAMIGGAFLTTKGFMSASDVTTTIGAVTTLIGVGQGVYVKHGTTAVPDLTATRADVPVVSNLTGQVTR